MRKMNISATARWWQSSSLFIAIFGFGMLLWRYPFVLLNRASSPTTLGQVRFTANNLNMLNPKIISAEELPASEAKWV
jgi:hypothetical protein